MLNAYVFASVALLSKYYILGREKGEFRRVRTVRTWNNEMHSTLHLHIELYVCILLLVTLNCYYELFYMNCNIDTCVTVNEL